jgi:hypothetical protein
VTPLPPLGILAWILSSLCGALIGGFLGWFVLGRFALFVLLRNSASVERGLRSMLGSRPAIYAVRDTVSKTVDAIAAMKVKDVAETLGLSVLIEEKLLPALAREESRRAAALAAGTLVAEQAGAALGDDALMEAAGVFKTYVPSAADAVVGWLRSPETRAYLSERGRELLPRIVGKLSDIQKLFISAGQFDRRLSENMPGIVDDTIQAAEKMLRDPRQQEGIVRLFFGSAQGWRDSLLVTPTGPPRAWSEPRQKLADAAGGILNRFMARLEDPRARHEVAERAAAGLAEDRRSLGAFAADLLGVRDSEITDILSARVLNFLVRPETAATIVRLLLPEAARGADRDFHLGRVGALVGGSTGLIVGLLLPLLRLLG